MNIFERLKQRKNANKCIIAQKIKKKNEKYKFPRKKNNKNNQNKKIIKTKSPEKNQKNTKNKIKTKPHEKLKKKHGNM